MQGFIDPRGRQRFVIISLSVFIATALAEAIANLVADPAGDMVGFISLLELIAMIGSIIAVSLWIYRVNANAHSFADGLSITPGWNVGWFFVPVASLFKPFEGVRETWQASHDPTDWPAVPVPGLLRAWWGCWLVGNILGNVGFQLNRAAETSTPVSHGLELVSSVAWIAAGALLIAIVRQLSDVQRRTQAANVFA